MPDYFEYQGSIRGLDLNGRSNLNIELLVMVLVTSLDIINVLINGGYMEMFNGGILQIQVNGTRSNVHWYHPVQWRHIHSG